MTAGDPTAVVGGPNAAGSGLAAYTHTAQDYVGRTGREVYHTQTLADGQGRPSSTQTMYNLAAATTSQYEAGSTQAVEGPSSSVVLSRLPSGSSSKQTPSPTATAGTAAWTTATPGYSAYEGISPSRSPGIDACIFVSFQQGLT